MSNSWSLVLWLAPALAGCLHAQTIGGRVLGDSSKRPIPGVRVVLVDSVTRDGLDTAVTDSAGIFYTNAAQSGAMFLRLERRDAVPRFSPTWHLAQDAFQQVTFLLPEGIERTAYPRREVDQEAAPDPRNTPPRYPTALRDRGVIANVRIRFIVDTTGRMIPESFHVVSATAPEFVDAVRAVMDTWRFYPARRAGLLVRELVCMPLVFRLSTVRDSRQLDSQYTAWRTHPDCPTS
jgi:TonB family protein